MPGDTDPVDALATLELELVLADVATVEAQIDKRRKAARSRTRASAAEVAAMERPPWRFSPAACPCTGPGSIPRRARCSRNLFLLTDKPVLAVVNLGEDQLDKVDAVVDAGGRRARAATVRRSASVCSSRPRRPNWPPTSAAELLEGLGSRRRGAGPGGRRARTTCSGGATFLTTGDKESRAWSFRAGATAAGVRRRHPLRPADGASSGPR